MSDDELKREIRAAMRRDPKEASRLVSRLARRTARSGDARTRAETRFLRAEVDMLQGRLRASARAYAEARQVFLRLKLPKQVLAAEIGAVQVAGLLGNAASVRTLSGAMRKRAKDPRHAAVAENAIGVALCALGDDAAAEESFRTAVRALGRSRASRARLTRATAQHNLALRLVRRGAARAAVREFARAQAAFESAGMPAWAARVRHNRAWALGVAGEVTRALAELAEVGPRFAADGNARGAALVRVDEAEIAMRLGAHARAAELATAAAARLPPLEAGRARLLAARAHAALGNRAAATRLAGRARKLLADAGDKAGAARADVVLGRAVGRAEATLRRLGHWMGAIDALLRRDLPPARLAAAAKRYPAALRRWVRPQLLFRQARSIAGLRRAYRAAEELRGVAPAGALRAGTLHAHLHIYEALARALLERGTARDRREAFLVIDALRSRTLREEMEAEEPGSTEPAAARELRRRLERLWRAVERNEGDPGDLRAAPMRVLSEISRCEKDYLEARERVAAPARARQAETRLPDAPCITFAVIDGDVIGMLAAGGEVTTWNCGRLGRLREQLAAFAFQVTRRLHGARDTVAAEACLERLRGALLPPVALPDEVHVVMPPELGGVPLEALAENTRFVHVPFACARGRAWRRGGRAMVVGIESQHLPDVKAEVETVAKRLGRPMVLKGAAAERDSILRGAAGRTLLHIAGHAQAREDVAPLSALRVRDGWITASDLGSLDLRESLVVLSACRTGDPSLRWHTEALGGFPRALLVAGASGVVASRWDVPDEIARAWMTSFYRHLGRHSPSAALARAARDVRRMDRHPAAWSAFLYVQGGVTNR